MTVDDIILNQQLKVSAKNEEKLQELLSKMETFVKSQSDNITDSDWHLAMAEGLYSTSKWEKAAFHFEKALIDKNEEWEIHFSKAVSFANTPNGKISVLKALQGYNDAICFFPKSEEDYYKARMYIYRGAMFKRLNRLEEAESDINYGLEITNNPSDQHDATYNLVCIYAMRGEKKPMLVFIEQLMEEQHLLDLIQDHLNDYFQQFKNDPELLDIINPHRN